MRNNISIILTSILLLTISLSGFAGESAINTEIGNEIAKKTIIPVLIAHKLCREAQSCWANDDHIKMSAGGGVRFDIYGITDRKLVTELLVAIAEASNQYPAKLQISVDIFAHMFVEKSIWKDPIASMLIMGEK